MAQKYSSFRNQIKFLHRKLFLLKIDFDVLEILIFRLRQPCWQAQPHKSVIVVVLSFSSMSTFLWHQCWAKPSTLPAEMFGGSACFMK